MSFGLHSLAVTVIYADWDWFEEGQMIRFVWAVLCVATCGAATVGETDRFLPLAQDGGGWSTQVTVVQTMQYPF